MRLKNLALRKLLLSIQKKYSLLSTVLALPSIFIPIALCSSIFISTGWANECSTNQQNQPVTTFPNLNGRLVYHNYINYGDGSSQLFIYDFKTRQGMQISRPSWNIVDPMNAHFSPDGQSITFMGKQNSKWHIFIWHLGADKPINLTINMNADRNEDPKFSFEGNEIVFKQDGNIKIMRLSWGEDGRLIVTRLISVTNDGYANEASMPYLTPTAKYVLYMRIDGQKFEIYRSNLFSGAIERVNSPSDVVEYYPVVRDYSTYFYTRWNDNVNHIDQIYMKIMNQTNSVSTALKLNDCNANNSDPAPVDEDNLIFSSTRNSTTYQLYLGDIVTGNVWSLNPFGINNIEGHKLGASYTNKR